MKTNQLEKLKQEIEALNLELSSKYKDYKSKIASLFEKVELNTDTTVNFDLTRKISSLLQVLDELLRTYVNRNEAYKGILEVDDEDKRIKLLELIVVEKYKEEIERIDEIFNSTFNEK